MIKISGLTWKWLALHPSTSWIIADSHFFHANIGDPARSAS
jgi:hypothetical protein